MHASGGVSENQLYGRWNAWVHSWKILRTFPAGWGVRTFLTRDAARTSALRPGGAQWAQRGARNSVWLRRWCVWWQGSRRATLWGPDGDLALDDMRAWQHWVLPCGPKGHWEIHSSRKKYKNMFLTEGIRIPFWFMCWLVFIGHHAIATFTDIVAFNFTSVL